MREFAQILKESRSKKLFIADLDDTLFRVDPNITQIHKYVDGKLTKLSTDEYAKDPDQRNPETKYVERDDLVEDEGIFFSFEEFNDLESVKKGFKEGTPIIKNLKTMDQYLNKGYDFAFLTARGNEKTLIKVLIDILKYTTTDGKMKALGDKFNKADSFAVGDPKYTEFEGMKVYLRKAYVLKQLAKKYDEICYIDDDINNLIAAHELNLPHLTTIQAEE